MKKIVLAPVLLLAISAISGWSQNVAGPKAKDASTSGAANETKVSVPPGPTYVIGPADTLLISVWKEPDLTATLPVRPDGMISVPLLNDVQAAGLTPMQLAASVRDKLKKYIADPRVTVVVMEMNSQRVYVMGEVLKTGPLPLLPDMTVMQALATAGFTQFANTKGIYVLRSGQGKQVKIPVNYKALVKGESSDRNIVLRPGDTVVVP